jgi:hypothetical protein
MALNETENLVQQFWLKRKRFNEGYPGTISPKLSLDLKKNVKKINQKI